MTDTFWPREFLRSRNAVLVHFSTLTTSRPELTFPNDIMRQAMGLRRIPLSFSTTQPGDTNPFRGPRSAEGSVGMIVDIASKTVIRSVYHGDSGSREYGSLGCPTTEDSCASSTDRREPSNERHVRDYLRIGIFILLPIIVRQIQKIEGLDKPVSSEVALKVEQAIAPFPPRANF